MLIQKLAFTPDLLALHAAHPAYFPYLLQSAAGQGWDILMAAPQQQRLYEHGQAREFWRDLAALALDGAADSHFPFSGGWFAYLGYELLHALEPVVPNWPTSDFPLACLTRIPAAILCERASGQAWIMAEAGFEGEMQLIGQRIDAGGLDVAALAACRPLQLHEEDEQFYLHGVERIRRYIEDGDVFQVNLSRAWHAELAAESSPAAIYRQLRAVNSGPFNALADFGRAQVISSSPERLLSIRQGIVSTRPIAGTHPRSVDAAEDAALKMRLLGSSKERAEHIMLIDLERNDLGRICVPGSVKVEELMSVQTYAFVHHIESVVAGRLRNDVHAAAALAALFPGGTITGCPKVRTMQIIRELESGARGAYTGSLGYINHDGSMDFNILIRSFMHSDRQLFFRAGAGIVADSQPRRELAETRAKAKGLLRALEAAHVAA